MREVFAPILQPGFEEVRECCDRPKVHAAAGTKRVGTK